ncbi:MAG: glycosyltransferase family 9 protein [Deltaproteobacteria bacterium]|nr:glycosyltransferase family 9 protein [Deltaproteobacteria bacterium]
MYRIINKKKLYATMAADLLGNAIFLPKVLLKKREEICPEKIKEILIIRTAYIGDVVMALPLLKPLRERFTNAKISFLTSAKAKKIIENNPYVDEIIAYDPFWFYDSDKRKYIDFIRDLKRRSFDLVIETRGDIREIMFLVFPLKAGYKVSHDVGGGGCFLSHVVPYKGTVHRVDYHLDIARSLGCETCEEVEWGIYLTKDEKKRVQEILKEEGVSQDKPLIALHPGSRKELKCWFPEGYAAVADFVASELCGTVVLTGSPDEVPLVEEVKGLMENRPIVLAGKTTLRELAGVISHCSLFICNDSSPMHIAAAMKTPTVAIFGPSKSIETGPYGKGHIVIEKDFRCRYRCDEDVCLHKNYNQCIKDISVDDVISAVRDVWSSKN